MQKLAVLATGLMCLFSPVTNAIPITQGFVEIQHTGGGDGSVELSFAGPGFSLVGRGGASWLVPCLSVGWCEPGTTRRETASVSSEDRGLIGTLTLGTESYSFTALPSFGPWTGLDLQHIFEIPNVSLSNPPATLTLTAPFQAIGGFSAGTVQPNWDGPDVDMIFTGQGIATVDLRLFAFAGASPIYYEFVSSRYDFLATPELRSALLMVTALAGLSIRNLLFRMSHQP